MRIVLAGFICGLLCVVVALGNVTLLARGELVPLIASLAAAMLFASIVLAVLTAYLSDVPGQVTPTQEISVVGLASVTGSAAAAFHGTQGALLATVLAAIGITTMACGLVMFVLGRARLGRIIRFVPYPVFAGFLTITGWFLLTGGLETVIGAPLRPELLPALSEPQTLSKIGLALAFIAGVEVLNRRLGSGALLPIAVIVLVVLFNLVVVVAGVSRTTLEATGWVFSVPAGSMNWPPVGLPDIAAIDWAAAGQGLLFAPFAIIITTAAAMMNVSGIELEQRRDIDLDRELRSMGIGNLLSGLVGGLPGFPAVSATLLAVRLGAASRAVGLVVGAVCLAALAFAPQMLAIVPAPLLGALLMAFGISFLSDWFIRPFARLRRGEYAVIVLILAVSIVSGFPAAIGVGLMAALALFAFEYARIDPVRYVTSGRDYHSRALSEEHRRQLAERGAAIIIMKLSGFVFFGSSDRIVQRIAGQLSAAAVRRIVVLDFRHVRGVDSSAALSFERLRRLAAREKFDVVFSDLGSVAAPLAKSGLALEGDGFHMEPDLDAAVAWAERKLLGVEGAETAELPLTKLLARFLSDAALAVDMQAFLAPLGCAPGDRLIEQGSSADDIYFIEAGQGSVLLEAAGTNPLTLMSFGPGAILGEIAFYSGEPRTASAIAATPLRAWKLSRDAVRQIEEGKPDLAAAFHRTMARILSQRLQSADRLIRVLAD